MSIPYYEGSSKAVHVRAGFFAIDAVEAPPVVDTGGGDTGGGSVVGEWADDKASAGVVTDPPFGTTTVETDFSTFTADGDDPTALTDFTGSTPGYSGWLKLVLTEAMGLRFNTYDSGMHDTVLLLFAEEAAPGAAATPTDLSDDTAELGYESTRWSALPDTYDPPTLRGYNASGRSNTYPAGTYWLMLEPYDGADWDNSEALARINIVRSVGNDGTYLDETFDDTVAGSWASPWAFDRNNPNSSGTASIDVHEDSGAGQFDIVAPNTFFAAASLHRPLTSEMIELDEWTIQMYLTVTRSLDNSAMYVGFALDNYDWGLDIFFPTVPTTDVTIDVYTFSDSVNSAGFVWSETPQVVEMQRHSDGTFEARIWPESGSRPSAPLISGIDGEDLLASSQYVSIYSQIFHGSGGADSTGSVDITRIVVTGTARTGGGGGGGGSRPLLTGPAYDEPSYVGRSPQIFATPKSPPGVNAKTTSVVESASDPGIAYYRGTSPAIHVFGGPDNSNNSGGRPDNPCYPSDYTPVADIVIDAFDDTLNPGWGYATSGIGPWTGDIYGDASTSGGSTRTVHEVDGTGRIDFFIPSTVSPGAGASWNQLLTGLDLDPDKSWVVEVDFTVIHDMETTRLAVGTGKNIIAKIFLVEDDYANTGDEIAGGTMTFFSDPASGDFVLGDGTVLPNPGVWLTTANIVGSGHTIGSNPFATAWQTTLKIRYDANVGHGDPLAYVSWSTFGRVLQDQVIRPTYVDQRPFGVFISFEASAIGMPDWQPRLHIDEIRRSEMIAIDAASTLIVGASSSDSYLWRDGTPSPLPAPAGFAGTDRGVDSSLYAKAINSAGDIVGSVTSFAGSARSQPVVWRSIGTVAEYLALPAGGSDGGEALGINDAGEIVGWVYDSANLHPLPACWDADGNVHVLDVLSAIDVYGQAYSIGNDGVAAGISRTDSSAVRAVRWASPTSSPAITAAGLLGGYTASFVNSTAGRSVDPSGDFVGFMTGSFPTPQAAVKWVLGGGGVTQLGSTGGAMRAMAISDTGKIVGDDSTNAIVWDSAAHAPVSLPRIGASAARAWGVSRDGTIIVGNDGDFATTWIGEVEFLLSNPSGLSPGDGVVATDVVVLPSNGGLPACADGSMIDTFENRTQLGSWGTPSRGAPDWSTYSQGTSGSAGSSVQLGVSPDAPGTSRGRIILTLSATPNLSFPFSNSAAAEMKLAVPEIANMNEFVLSFDMTVNPVAGRQGIAVAQIFLGGSGGTHAYPGLDLVFQFEHFDDINNDHLDWNFARDAMGGLPGSLTIKRIVDGVPTDLAPPGVTGSIANVHSFDGTITIDRSVTRGSTLVTVGGLGTYQFPGISAWTGSDKNLYVAYTDFTSDGNTLDSSTLSIDNIRVAGVVAWHPGTIYDGVTFRHQIGDPTTIADQHICLLESAAMVLDWHTRGGLKLWGGELIPWCGRPLSSILLIGTSLDNAKQAWAHFGQVLDVRATHSWIELLACLTEGRAVILGGEYVALAPYRCDDFTGGHAICVLPIFDSTGLKVLTGDPLCADFKYVPLTALHAFASAQGVAFYGDASKLYFAVSRAWPA